MDEIYPLIRNNEAFAQQLVYDLAGLIHRLVPNAEQKIYPGWGVIDYQLGGRRDYLSIGPQKKYVNLYFMRGVELPDPGHLLTGSGKNMRHVKIRTTQDLQDKRLHTLILNAAKL